MKNDSRKNLFRKRLPKYKKDPILFAKEVLKFTPEPYQKEMLMDLADFPKVSVKSGQGIGKTASEAVAALWFLSCFPFARVVATAPTAQQLNDVLWAELNKWISRSDILKTILHWTKTYVYVDGYERRWFAVAKTASQPENMQGFHEDNMLFIVDEASGVEDEIMEAVLGTLSGNNNKLLMCGNPTRISGTFYDSHTRDRALYKCHTVSSLDSKRTNKENIEMFKRKYGEQSNVYRVRVLGEFPAQEDDVFIPLPLIERSVMTEVEAEKINHVSMGVDVARYGDDETVISTNVGGAIKIPVVRHGQSLMTTVGDIVIMYKKLIAENPTYKGVITINIDDTGLGGGVTDRLEEVKTEQMLRRMEIVPVNFGMKPPQDGSEEHYEDISTYMWATIKTLMENKEISIENDEELVAQLSVRKYSITSNGKIVLESKKTMKARGIKSPDRADAVALSCYSQNKVYNAFIERTETVMISYDVLRTLPIAQINVGVSIGNAFIGTSFVATAIIAGHKRAVVLSSERFDGDNETNALGKFFCDFCKKIQSQYKRIDYAFVDATEQFMFKSMRDAAERENLSVIVRNAANDSVNNRIRLTTMLLTQNRLFLTNSCEQLARAFTTAIWSDKKSVESRSDSSDTGMLNAFEYTIEREAGRFLRE